MPLSNRVVRDGLIVGLIGYAAVALFYAGFDLLASRGTLFTVNMLSQSLFTGATDTAALQFGVEPDLSRIFWYNALHLAVSLVIGLIVVYFVEQIELGPWRARVAAFVIASGYVFTIVAIGMLSRDIRPMLPWWSIVTVNTLAVALGGAYLMRRRPGLLGRLAQA